MSNHILKNLLKDCEMKKYTAELAFENQKLAFYSSHPELVDINTKLGKIAIDISKAILKQDIKLANELKIEFNNLKEKKEVLLNSLDIPSCATKPLYDCPICEDTGFITDKSGKSTLCNCIKQKLFDINFNKSNIR